MPRTRGSEQGDCLEVLHVLLKAEKPLTIKEIQGRMLTPVERKAVSTIMDRLEVCGFKTEIIKQPGRANKYRVEV